MLNNRNTVIYRTASILSSVNINNGVQCQCWTTEILLYIALLTFYRRSISTTVSSANVEQQKHLHIALITFYCQSHQHCCPVPLLKNRNNVIYRAASILSSVNINNGVQCQCWTTEALLYLALITFYVHSVTSTLVSSSTVKQQKHCHISCC
jgi:hypothetical protein